MSHVRLVGLFCFALAVSSIPGDLGAQPPRAQQKQEQPEPQLQEPEAPAKETPPKPAQFVHPGPNVRVEATIRDDRPGSNIVTKVVSVAVADGEEGRVRTIVMPKGAHAAPLNVDVRPIVQSNGRIFVRLALQYDLDHAPADDAEAASQPDKAPIVVIGPAGRSSVNETIAIVLEDGKPMIVTQSADALTDRKVTVEVKATVLK
jgi:hypothetical protein